MYMLNILGNVFYLASDDTEITQRCTKVIAFVSNSHRSLLIRNKLLKGEISVFANVLKNG